MARLDEVFRINEGPGDPALATGEDQFWTQLRKFAVSRPWGEGSYKVIISGDHGHVEFVAEMDKSGQIFDIWEV